MQVFKLSAKNGQGMEEYLSFLQKRLDESRVAATI
jgi:hypothetical protein